MFEVVGTKSLDSNAIEFIETGINFVGRTFENNGVQGKIQKRNFEPNKPFTITATVIGNYKYVKYQKEPYYCSQNINKLTPRSTIKKWSDKIAYFFIASIQKFVSLYDGQQGGYKLVDINNHIIRLPLKENSLIDFDFMESFISELEQERISELNFYLKATGLSNYILTNEEKKVLNNFKNYKWQNFRIGDLFEIHSPKKKFNAADIDFGGKYPYVARISENNGIKNYTNQDIKYLNPRNTISYGQDTATIFYQPNDYFTSDKIKIMEFKSINFNEKIAMFLISAMNRSFLNFSWGTSSFNENILRNTLVKLPTVESYPDYILMETLIKAIYKLVIRDVVFFIDKKIATTKKIVNK